MVGVVGYIATLIESLQDRTGKVLVFEHHPLRPGVRPDRAAEREPLRCDVVSSRALLSPTRRWDDCSGFVGSGGIRAFYRHGLVKVALGGENRRH